MGFALQMTRWPEGLKRGLADAGFRVIWLDNRDVCLSTEFTKYTPPSPMDVLTAAMTGQDASKLVPYTVKDMAADAEADEIAERLVRAARPRGSVTPGGEGVR
jgi:hypothetical protein